MKHILVAMPFDDTHKAYIEKIGTDCEFRYTTIKTATAEEVKAADIIFGNISPELVKQNDHLEWMQLNSAGSDQYCKPGVIGPDTILTCATGAYGLSVSEHMVSMSMMLCRKMDLYMKNQINHEWKEEGSVTSIWNSTTLVAGLGDIGSEYAKRMKALGSHVIGIRRNVAEKPDFIDELHTMGQLDEVLPKVDFAAFILPSTPATHHIMDERRLRLMKPGSYLINAGRGDAVDCDALNKVLREGGALAGCALDVTEPEPLPADHRLWNAPNLLITPHVSGGFSLPETLEKIVGLFADNLERYFAGQPIENLVNLQTGYRE